MLEENSVIQPKKKRLFISFSGGKTSAYMTDRLLSTHEFLWDEIVVGFANTGEEHEKTLEYVENCNRRYRFNVVWLESVFDPVKGVGTKHHIVSYDTAARKGEPFEQMILKHGLPNSQFPHCTRELKRNAIRSYLRSIGWESGSYETAIGIRFDELDRISPRSVEEGAVYPLIDWRIVKQDVLTWESEQSVRLGIPEHWGNCKWCWKKSFRKLGTLALDMPEAFDFPRRVEAAYPDCGPGFGDRRMFRNRKTTADIFALARDPDFVPFTDSFKYANEDLDQGLACGESCEIGVDGSRDDGLLFDPEERQLA